MKLYYFLVNGAEPLIADDIDYVKSLRGTKDVIFISKEQFEEIASYYIVYRNMISSIIKNRKN